MNNNAVFAVAIVCATTIIVACVSAIYNYNVTPFKQGYSEVQRQGSPQTMWVAPTTNWDGGGK